MSKSHKHSPIHRQQIRQHLATEAARIICESGLDDFHHARRKAATRLGVVDSMLMPEIREIEQAIQDHRRLFGQEPSHLALLESQREAALAAMEFFHQFQPRLTGAVLEGHAHQHGAVCLHLHSDDPSAVAAFLQDNGIPARAGTRRLRLAPRHVFRADIWTFKAEQTAFELLVLPLAALRQPPLGEGDNRPVKRASLTQLRRLLESH